MKWQQQVSEVLLSVLIDHVFFCYCFCFFNEGTNLPSLCLMYDQLKSVLINAPQGFFFRGIFLKL